MKRRRAAVICANGIGDGLLMMVAAASLAKKGFHVTILHKKGRALASLFPSTYIWLPYIEAALFSFDLLLLQNDQGKIATEILQKRAQFKNLFVIHYKKNTYLQKGDFLLDPKQSMIRNIARALHQWVGSSPSLLDNDLLLPPASYRKHAQRVVIHPTSSGYKKNWTPIQFLILAQNVQKLGYSPLFTLFHKEQVEWRNFLQRSNLLYTFCNLPTLAHLLYESGYFIGNDSGLGHLASNLQIPTLTIFSNHKLYPLWKPDWYYNESVMTSFPLPNWKGLHLRIREWIWPSFVSLHKVTNAFYNLIQRDL